MIQEVLDTFDKLKELHIKKNQDYTGKSEDPFYNFNFAEIISSEFHEDDDKVFATMIGIKLGRISAMLNCDGKTNFESILDSFDDAIVYLALWKAKKMRTDEKEVVGIYDRMMGLGMSNSIKGDK